MRTRTIMTVAILSVGSGCSRQPPPSHTVAAAPAAPAPPAASAPRIPAPPVPLAELATELRAIEPTLVAARAAHFRPLCDADGFPLVGNLVSKNVDSRPGPVAAFCADVRATAAR